MREIELVLRGDIYGSLMDGLGHLKDVLVAWVGAKHFQTPFLIKNEEVCGFDIIQGGSICHRGVAKGGLDRAGGNVAEEVIPVNSAPCSIHML